MSHFEVHEAELQGLLDLKSDIAAANRRRRCGFLRTWRFVRNVCRFARTRSNRRYQYPYVNCTNCGPRYSIIRRIPYDRANTTMSAWQLCEECRANTKTRSIAVTMLNQRLAVGAGPAFGCWKTVQASNQLWAKMNCPGGMLVT